MKRISIIIAMMVLGALSAMAQSIEDVSKSEYRYWNFVLGINHGLGGSIGSDYNQLMLHTNMGDMYKETKGFTYTPGYHVGLVYNYDFLNNKTGIVTGIEFANYGFKNKMKSTITEHSVKETFRSMAVTVPVLLKFSGSDIYRDMKYYCIGVKLNYNIAAARQQKASWTGDKFGQKLSGDLADAKSALSCAATLGFNYNIISVNINYMFMDFVNADFVNAEQYTPFNGIKGHIYLCTSLNLPMTRWLCVNNWTAEKIRRKIKHANGM